MFVVVKESKVSFDYLADDNLCSLRYSIQF